MKGRSVLDIKSGWKILLDKEYGRIPLFLLSAIWKAISSNNFIIATGQPYSLMYQRIKYLLSNYSETSEFENDANLTNYETLMNISNQLFNRQGGSSSIEQSASTAVKTCCHGFTSMPMNIVDISDLSQLDTFKKGILDILDLETDSAIEEQEAKLKSASWIMIEDSMCLEPALLNVFLQLDDKNSSLLSFSLSILCFLVNEQKLFENWFFHDLPIEDYQSNIYPEYERQIKSFFSFLNSSEYLQQNTLLINEEDLLIDNGLQILLQNVFRSGSSKYKANSKRHRCDMAKLLFPRRRTMRDVRGVRNSLQKVYNQTVQNRLKPLFDDLKEITTAAATNAAREITHIVLDEYVHNDAKHSNTISAKLIQYALYLLRNDNYTTSTPLIYSIICVICRLGTHFIFRHELFNNTPEIYTLSLLLITQRQYALTLSGLQLCVTILNGDQIEHKYALTYLKHDESSTRKILDAMKWLFSPYITLKTLWKEEDEKRKAKENDESVSDKEESAVHIAERFCVSHADILLQRSYIGGLASLFYGSTDHCAQVTENDMHTFAEVISVLADPRMAYWHRGESKSRLSLIFISELCEVLTPVLLYSSPSVHLALLHEDSLLVVIPRAIRLLLENRNTSKAMINTCVQFYIQFVQSKCKQPESVDKTKNEYKIEQSNVKTTEQNIDPPASLNLSQDLISSYFDLHCRIQETSVSDKKIQEQEQFRKLLEGEWKKLDTVQLQHDNEQLKHDNVSLQQELLQLRDELHRTQVERDQFRKENMRLAQEIDRIKLMPVTIMTEESQQTSTLVSPANNNQENTIDELKNLAPLEITRQQAEQCIHEIYHRRTTFNDPDMRKSICGSLKHLGSDLYSSPVHFLHELIQNAEDNFYDNTVVPYLRIELNHSYILLSNNEQGLRANDVLAICSLAVSTKTIQQEQIGEKGVGFKSVFAASNQPMLISHAWRFCFHVPGLDAMSYITPLCITDQDIPDCISNQISTHPQDTYLYLPLKLQSHTSDAELFLNQAITAADPCILLNMRHLKKLEIIDKRENKLTVIEKQLIGSTKLEEQSSVTFEDFSFLNLTGSRIKLGTSLKFNTFRVYTCYIDIPNSIEQRRSPRTRLILAFPCEDDYRLTSTVYTGLPVCDLGFNFLFNADFQLVTSRENVRENVPFNTYIRDHLAALFVYLLLNDNDLRKDINRYCPSSNIHQLKHSSWWLTMIDNINELITKHLSVLFDIRTGKAIRHINKDLTLLVSNEQLYNCADIQVIDSDTGFLTAERLKSFQIQSVSIVDVLNCFPNRGEEASTTNEFRQQFQLWAQNQDKQWWSQLFHHVSQTMTSVVSNVMVQKPIFLLSIDHQRQYLLQTSDDRRLLLFISDDPSFQMWKRQITLLHFSSDFERTALLKSNRVQLLTEERMIEIIYHDHLQIADSSINTNVDPKLIEEIWKDLLYLKSRIDKLDKSSPFLIPVNNTSSLAVIQNSILPTILKVDIRSLMYPTASPIIHYPYYNIHRHQLSDILQWEYFLLQMNCQRPSIYLPLNDTITKLPFVPSFTMFTDEKCARMGEFIFSAQTENTKDCFRQFPIVADSKDEQQISPISATFNKTIVHDLPSLPCIVIPSYCRTLAINLGVCVEYDLRTCVTILQLLSDEKNTNVDLYIQWLGHLQLYVRQQQSELNPKSLLASCQLYLPDQKKFYPLEDLLITPDNEEHHNGILLVSKYLKLQWISPSINQVYWQFKDLFRLLNCTCTISIAHIYNTIYQASVDKNNFFTLGDCNTTLTESGMETMIILFQYLEDLILKCVKENTENDDLYRAIIDSKHPTAPCGSRDDLQWRFSFTCNSLSKQLKKVTGIQSQKKKISLPTIDRRLITKTTENIVYACLEMIITQNLSKDFGKRYFISPLIARTCPLVLATFEIDYVERRGKLEWEHKNHNMECQLTQLTDIVRHAVNDFEIEVITAKYARITLLLSDSFVIDSIDESNEDKIDRYSVDTEYPFWIFNKTILLCTGYGKRDGTRAIIAISALTTLLHKRKYVPLEEAKSIAQQRISACTAFRSDQIARVAGAESSIYSYTDILFPTDHQSIESMIISIGNYCTIEKDLEDDTTITEVITDRVAENRIAEDRIYRNRVPTQNHVSRNDDSTTKNSTDSLIVNGIEEIRIGQNAEHFFFVYLQSHYGTVDVTPTKNWRSSSRLVTYPQYRRNIDDAAGFDFELHDTQEVFVRSSKSTTKKCYFEVKGTNGSYDEEYTRFHISQNELNVCQAISTNGTRRECEAYFIVLIQNCLDPEKISFGTVIDWSSHFDRVYRTVDSYQCRIVSSPSTNLKNSRREVIGYNNHQQQSTNSNNRDNNSMTQSVAMSRGNSTSTCYKTPHLHNQEDQSMRTNNRNNNFIPQSASTNTTNSTSNSYHRPHGQYQPTNSDNRGNNSMAQYVPTTNSNSMLTRDNPPPRQNQQQRGQPFHPVNSNNNVHYQQTPRKKR